MPEFLHEGVARFVLAPKATCGMFPPSAKLIAGDPNKIKLRIDGKFSVSEHHVWIEMPGPTTYSVHKDFIRSVWDLDEKNILWRNSDYGEAIK